MQIEKTQNVWVTFNGREDKINMIRAGEVSAVVDLANAEIGSNELPVTINSEFSSYIIQYPAANANIYRQMGRCDFGDKGGNYRRIA